MKRFFSSYVGGAPALGLLILRVVFGAALMYHGWGKIQAPFNWMEKAGMPSPAPSVLQALQALGEFGGGTAIVFGLLTPLACLGVLGAMFGVWFVAHRGTPWINPGGKAFELESLYFAVALTLIFTGPGRFSLDALIWGRRKH